MTDRPHSLAIETSSRRGGVALGRGEELLEAVALPEQRRHAVELLPIIDALLKRHGLTPASIGELHVSVGPGSFTGLRVGITTAKTLAMVTGCTLVAVPTLDVIVQNAPITSGGVAVCLNAKRGQCFTGIFDRSGDQWAPRIEPALWTPEQMLAVAPRPLLVIGDALGEHSWPEGVQLAGSELAVPRAEVVWRLGRRLAASGHTVDPIQLVPLYIRLPEAEELWQERNRISPQRHRGTE